MRALIGNFWIALFMAGASDLLVRVRQFEQHATGAHDGDPELGVALAGAHAGLGRLLGDGLVGEDVDPHLATTLDGAGHGDTSSFDLAGAEPAWARAWIPYSPKARCAPPLVRPEVRPRWCLRCATLRGINMMNQSSPRKCGASDPPCVRRAISSSSSSSFSNSGSASLINGAVSTSPSVGRRPDRRHDAARLAGSRRITGSHCGLTRDLVFVDAL